jgi:hypothetical protein
VCWYIASVAEPQPERRAAVSPWFNEDARDLAFAVHGTLDVQLFAVERRSREPSPGSELAPSERVLWELVLAWVPQPDWESSPEYRWVPSRVDEHESRATSLIEQAGLPD